jgi:hypothetical protein
MAIFTLQLHINKNHSSPTKLIPILNNLVQAFDIEKSQLQLFFLVLCGCKSNKYTILTYYRRNGEWCKGGNIWDRICKAITLSLNRKQMPLTALEMEEPLPSYERA